MIEEGERSGLRVEEQAGPQLCQAGVIGAHLDVTNSTGELVENVKQPSGIPRCAFFEVAL